MQRSPLGEKELLGAVPLMCYDVGGMSLVSNVPSC